MFLRHVCSVDHNIRCQSPEDEWPFCRAVDQLEQSVAGAIATKRPFRQECVCSHHCNSATEHYGEDGQPNDARSPGGRPCDCKEQGSEKDQVCDCKENRQH